MYNRPPSEMADSKNWCLWGLGRDKQTGELNDKVPFHYSITKKYFYTLTKAAIEENSFYDFNEIINILSKVKDTENKYGKCLGIGYHFFNSNICGVDLDGIYDKNGYIRNIFECILDKCLTKTFVEYSKSKQGVHIYLKRDIELKQFNIRLADFENYLPNFQNLVGDCDCKKPPGIDMYLDGKSKFFIYTGEEFPTKLGINQIDYKLSDFKKIYDRLSYYHEKKKNKDNADRTIKRKKNTQSFIKTYIDGTIKVDCNYSYIKSNVSITEIFRKYTNLYNIQHKGKHKCMLSNHREGSKALLIYLDGHFNCESCGKSGSQIDLVSELFNLDKLEAIKKINQDFNLNLKING